MHSIERVPENLHQLSGFHPQNDAGENCRQEAAGAGGGQPVEIKLGVFRGGFGDHRLRAENRFVEIRHFPAASLEAGGGRTPHSFLDGWKPPH
jgi:hypothetical protein